MGRTFTVQTTKSATELVARGQRIAKERGATFEGTESAGRFQGKGVTGSYAIAGQDVTITIEKKPKLVPWTVVESGIKRFVAE